MEDSLIDQLRSWRIEGLALFDIILAVIGMVFISDWLHITKTTAVLLAIPIGIVTHFIFGINTTLNYKLGISDKPIKKT